MAAASTSAGLLERIKREAGAGYPSTEDLVRYGLAPYEVADAFDEWRSKDEMRARIALCEWADRYLEGFELGQAVVALNRIALEAPHYSGAAATVRSISNELSSNTDRVWSILRLEAFRRLDDKELHHFAGLASAVCDSGHKDAWRSVVWAVRDAAWLVASEREIATTVAAELVAEELRCVHASLEAVPRSARAAPRESVRHRRAV